MSEQEKNEFAVALGVMDEIEKRKAAEARCETLLQDALTWKGLYLAIVPAHDELQARVATLEAELASYRKVADAAGEVMQQQLQRIGELGRQLKISRDGNGELNEHIHELIDSHAKLQARIELAADLLGHYRPGETDREGLVTIIMSARGALIGDVDD